MTETYVFKGLRPFMEAAAQAHGRDLHQLGRAVELWHAKQIQNDLGQLPRLDPASQRELLAHAAYIREGLACALEGVDAAILEVCRECGLDVPACLADVSRVDVPDGPAVEPEPELFDTAIRRRFEPPRR